MRIRLPFNGTLLKSYEPGTAPSFDPTHRMDVLDDALGGYGYRVLVDTFDFDNGTVEVEVNIDSGNVATEEAAITARVTGKDVATLRSESERGGTFTDSR